MWHRMPYFKAVGHFSILFIHIQWIMIKILHNSTTHCITVTLLLTGWVPICIAPGDFWTCICTHENYLIIYCTLNCWQVEYLHTWSVVIFQPVYKIQSHLLPESNIDLEDKVVPSSCVILRHSLSLHHFGGPELFLSMQFWKPAPNDSWYKKRLRLFGFLRDSCTLPCPQAFPSSVCKIGGGRPILLILSRV